MIPNCYDYRKLEKQLPQNTAGSHLLFVKIMLLAEQRQPVKILTVLGIHSACAK